MLKHGRTPVTEIVVHQTTTRPDWMADKPIDDKCAEIDIWHKKRGWRGFGYHYLIDRDGKVCAGRPESEIGAHVGGYNTGRIGVSLVGGFGAAKDDPFEKHFTEQQNAALRELIDDIKTRANIKRVRGHSEFSNKACPGFNVQKWQKPPSIPRTHVAQSTTVQASGQQIIGSAAAGTAALAGLDGTAQVIAIVFCVAMALSAAWVMRERLIKWAEGDR